MQGVREPADFSPSSCSEIAKFFLTNQGHEKDLNTVLLEKKLITFTEKKIQLQYPRLEWINKIKISFNQSLRNLNNFRHPAFYLFNDENALSVVKNYVEHLDKILANTVAPDDEEITKSYVLVSDWTKAFQNYKTEIDQLIEERISLQYNISLLKKLKLNKNESRDILVSIKRRGVIENEVISLHAEDKNLEFTIGKLKQEMSDLDGTFIRNGKIKERIIRQAMLQDMLKILQRELEHTIKNASAPNELMSAELEKLSTILKDKEFAPSTYGVYKINDSIFIRELFILTKLDIAYKTIETPLINIKNILSNYFKNDGTDKEKVGILKRIYAKITSISPKQAAIGGTATITGAIGLERYFSFGKADSRELGAQEQAHLEQLERTREAEKAEHDKHAQAVEIQIEELIQ